MERLVWKKQTGSGGVRVSGQKKKVEVAITIFLEVDSELGQDEVN